jgi:hypothetical protein
MKSKFIIAQTSTSPSSSQRELEGLSALDIAFLSALSLGIILSIFIPIYDSLSKRKQRSLTPKPCAEPICPGCRYFSNNHYLQCALQPTIVMTKQSIDCQDYCSIHTTKPIKKVGKVLLTIRKVFTAKLND